MNELQRRDNLPAELTEARQWLPKLKGTKHAPTDWNNPETWRDLDEIEGTAIFNLNQTNLLVIDGDGIVDNNGEIYAKPFSILTRIIKAGGAKTYGEYSQSRRGIHLVYDLGEYADEFMKLTGGQIQFTDLPKRPDGKFPQLEFYYHTPHLFFFTGNMMKESADRILKGDGAAAAMRECVKAIEEYNPQKKPKEGKKLNLPEKINSGSRNNVLFKTACSLQVRGLHDDAIRAAISTMNDEQCDEPLPEKELEALVNSALKYEKGRAAKEAANNPADVNLKPEDYTDIGQAVVFRDMYGEKVRYSKATDFLIYDGIKWCEDAIKAQALAQTLTDMQLKEARKLCAKTNAELLAATEMGEDDAIKAALEADKAAKGYFAYVLGRRKNSSINNVLSQVRSMVQINVNALDADPYLLNTPGGAVDLKTGEIRPNKPQDYCTKVTAVAPSSEGADLFSQFMHLLTDGDQETIDYLQGVAGMCAVGTVKQEKLIIAYGEGGTGKSTFFNLLFRLFGDYAGMLSAETLTMGQRDNKKPELAELRGKRIVIAAELEEGQRMNTAMVKKLCSTDPIHAAKKFKDEFEFLPSHTMILYTNHLPKVGTNDSGTWRRLAVVPFRHKFVNTTGEIKNYADFLIQNAGGAVLSWVIEGARRFITNDFKIEEPACVRNAVDNYVEDNDWLEHFIDDCCDVGKGYSMSAGPLYQVYRKYCEESGEYTRSNADFKNAMERAGYQYKRGHGGVRCYVGLALADRFRSV